jgi:hypothetical protein
MKILEFWHRLYLAFCAALVLWLALADHDGWALGTCRDHRLALPQPGANPEFL